MRKLESLDRRGRALRAEIGRKVEELAHEESRALREAATEQQEAGKLRELVQVAERAAATAKAQADQAAAQGGSGSPTTLRAIYERTGAAAALLDARREALAEREQKSHVKDALAKDLRRQIDELRAQLARYAEALEEDLSAGREKVATRSREGTNYEKAFSDVSTLLLNHLKSKPEARDLLQELMSNMHTGNLGSARSPGGPESRGPM
jgi:serine/threonine-protein kinase